MSLEEALKRFRRQWRADGQTTYVKTERSGESARIAREIFDRVREYYELVHKQKRFIPFKTPIPYAGRVFDEKEMVSLVDSALDFWLTLGPFGDLFEQKMRTYFGARDFILVNSGSSANLVAVGSLMSHHLEGHLKKGDEVITPAVTFPSTLAPIVQNGLIPVFVDAEVGTYNINPHLIEKAISPRTRAVVVPHTLGNPCDMDIIGDIVRRHHLFLVEDTCDALGSTFQGRLVGTFGDIGTLSFFPAHHITTGEGGGVIINKARFSKIARSLRDWGRDCWCAPGESNTCTKRFGWQLGSLPEGYDHKYIYSHIGYNLKPTDLQAAVGVVQADRIQGFVEKRRQNFLRLYQALELYEDYITLPRWDPRSQPAWFGFPITVKNGVSKRKLVQWLESARIETRAVFGGNILRQPGYANVECRIAGELTQSDIIMRDTFFIGVYPGMTPEMIDFMIERLKGFFSGL
jgi:CDP-6-deoxy-D-xylo-4-hexulose-3-dehydrase